MNKQTEDIKRQYLKVFGAAILSLVAAIYLVTRSDKPRADFIHQSGEIVYLSRINPLQKESDARTKDIFLVLNNYDRVFELFTGTETGDFSPRVNRLAELRVGDKVDIYFEENNKSASQPSNRLLQYLDKNGELIYRRSNADQQVGYFIIGCSGLLFILGIHLRAKPVKS